MKNLKLAAALLFAAALCGCGGSGASYSGNTPMESPAPAVDAAFTQVNKAAATMPEDAEPGDLDAVVLAAPDDTEPAPL